MNLSQISDIFGQISNAFEKFQIHLSKFYPLNLGKFKILHPLKKRAPTGYGSDFCLNEVILPWSKGSCEPIILLLWKKHFYF